MMTWSVCQEAPCDSLSFKPIQQRIADRAFPSVFMAWAKATNLPHLNAYENIAHHDLAFVSTGALQLQWDHEWYGLARHFTPDSIPKARRIRQQLQQLNPNLILLVELRYRDAWDGFFPDDHPWWKRNKDGQRVKGWDEGRFYQMDYHNREYHQHLARRARAIMDTGAVDGIMLDWWSDDEHRLALIQTIRNAIGDDALILTNANDRQTPQTAPYINGYFMECWRSKTVQDWRRIADTLVWAETHLRKPRINCVEVWYQSSRQDYNRMRAVTTMVLTHSNGYCLFSDPNDLPTGDHRHDWYSFWDKRLGKPVAPGVIHPDGSARRVFENGIVIYNPLGNKEKKVTFDKPHKRLSNGVESKTHRIPALDGDIFLPSRPGHDEYSPKP